MHALQVLHLTAQLLRQGVNVDLAVDVILQLVLVEDLLHTGGEVVVQEDCLPESVAGFHSIDRSDGLTSRMLEGGRASR